MKVEANAIDAYGGPAKVAKTDAQPATKKADKLKEAGFNGKDFFTLSPKAQRDVMERMLLSSIGQKIGADFGELGIDLKDHIGEDQSPDAVSGRIVAFATGMFSVFQAQNPDMGEEELLNSFEETLRGAVDTGYEQASGILSSMDNMNSEIESIGNKTMRLVHEKLSAYFDERRSKGEEATVQAPAETPVAASTSESVQAA